MLPAGPDRYAHCAPRRYSELESPPTGGVGNVGPARSARPTITNLHARDGCLPRSVRTGAMFSARETASTLTAHHLSAWAQRCGWQARALGQFVAHSLLSGTVHRQPP